MPFLGYLDCRPDQGGERELQLAGRNRLGLRELGRRLVVVVVVVNKCQHNQVIIVFLVCSRRARQEGPQLQREPRVCFHWEKS